MWRNIHHQDCSIGLQKRDEAVGYAVQCRSSHPAFVSEVEERMVKTKYGMEDVDGRTEQEPQELELPDQELQLGLAKEADLGKEAAEKQDQVLGRA